MGERDRSVHLEDDRFLEARVPKKKKLHHSLHWMLGEDYFTDEILVLRKREIESYKKVVSSVFKNFNEALGEIIDQQDFDRFKLPSKFLDLIKYTWDRKDKHPFLYGRFDVNGILNNVPGKVIEFNADTCSTVPETLVWQPFQLHDSNYDKYQQFNDLEDHLVEFFQERKNVNGEHRHMILGSSLGYEEDQVNTNVILDLAFDAGWATFYADLPEVSFDRDNGIYLERFNEFYKADYFFKFFPWDWIFFEEPELGDDLYHIIMNDYCTVLNPAYTHLWQNKRFMAYLTERYPNDVHLAKTYLEKTESLSNEIYVAKPVLGRIGENVEIHDLKYDAKTTSKGDYGDQDQIFQEYVENPLDGENYRYQAGVFVTEKGTAALNYRTAENDILTDDCEFICHCFME